jgi:hypothetical protein
VETLAEIVNPRPIYINPKQVNHSTGSQQVNNAEGPQQVNNGPPAGALFASRPELSRLTTARVAGSENQANKLLEAK